ncbi:MAG: hypothetical protein HY744_13940 [Deltaproteobacteria bacterium]|nr:hypothetical protein [Deltaproteobacteria bacterium]
MLTAACSGGPGPTHLDNTGLSSSSSGEGGAGGSAGAGHGAAGSGAGSVGERIVIGPTQGELALPFSFSAQATGTSFVGKVNVDGAAGTVELGGTSYGVVVYEKQPFKDYRLYQTLAVGSERWYVLWLYCLKGGLESIYYEGTDGKPIEVEASNGACAESDGASTAHVSFPAVDMPWPPLIDGYTIEGAQMHLAGSSPGTVELPGGSFTVLGFSEVDCTKDCGKPGWWELHALLWDGARAGFAIFYLFDGKPVLVTYALTLPDLADPAGYTTLDATWSRTAQP